MLNFSKSRLDSDLQNRTIVQHKVVCDWLRQIQQQNIQLSRKITALTNRVDSLLENEGSPDSMETDSNDSSSSS